LSRARAALPAMLEDEPIEASVLDPVDLLTSRSLTRRRTQREDESLLSLLPHARRRGTFRDPAPEVEGGRDEIRDDATAILPLPRDLADDPPRRASVRRGQKGRETLVYRVGPGDTVIGIARQFAMDADDVTRQNRLDEGERLKVGALLKLRVRRDL